MWDIPTKDKLYTIDIGVYAVAFDPAGKYLAGAGMDDVVYVWDADTQDTVFVLGGHQQKINAIAFDPSGSYLVSGGDDLTVRVGTSSAAGCSSPASSTPRSSRSRSARTASTSSAGTGTRPATRSSFASCWMIEDRALWIVDRKK